jgi:hypothetical protein
MRYLLKLDQIVFNSNWFELMGNGDALFQGYSTRNDLMIRARSIVQRMRANGQRILRTMDGHGRFVYCFLAALREAGENIDDWDIDLFEIDDQVHEWHMMMMPTDNVRNVLADILQYPTENAADFHSTTLVYFNFCGLGKLIHGGKRSPFRQVLQWFIEDGADVYVSWSVRGVTPVRGSDAYSFGRWIGDSGVRVSRRGNFYTYHIPSAGSSSSSSSSSASSSLDTELDDELDDELDEEEKRLLADASKWKELEGAGGGGEDDDNSESDGKGGGKRRKTDS